MDSWKHHLMFGLILQFIFIDIMMITNNWYKELNFLFPVVLLISPLIPDLDHKQGKLREALTFIGLILGLLGVVGYYTNVNLTTLMVYGIILSSFAYMLFYVTTHRGFLHTIPCCAIFSLILYIITSDIQVVTLGFIGCYSHLIGDKLYFKVI